MVALWRILYLRCCTEEEWECGHEQMILLHMFHESVVVSEYLCSMLLWYNSSVLMEWPCTSAHILLIFNSWVGNVLVLRGTIWYYEENAGNLLLPTRCVGKHDNWGNLLRTLVLENQDTVKPCTSRSSSKNLLTLEITIAWVLNLL